MNRGSAVRLGLLALIWGSSFLLMKFAVEGMDAVQLVLGRLLAGAAVLFVIVAVKRVPIPRDPVVWGHLAVMSVIANIIPFFAFAWAEDGRVGSGMAGILNGTTPLFTLVFALMFLPEERWSPQRAAGLALGFVGAVVVIGPWNVGAGNTVAGQLACLGAGACYGVGLVYARRYVSHRGIPPLALSAVQLGLATVLLGVTAPLTATAPMQLTPLVVGSAFVLGAVGTGLAYLLFYRVIIDVGATSASLVTYLIPIVAVTLGVIVQGEPLTWNIFVGAAVVIAGAALAEGRIATRPVTDAPVATAPQELAR